MKRARKTDRKNGATKLNYKEKSQLAIDTLKWGTGSRTERPSRGYGGCTGSVSTVRICLLCSSREFAE